MIARFAHSHRRCCWPPSRRAGHAQSKYPDKPIKIVVGFTAGGGTDVAARIVGAEAQRSDWARPSWSRTGPAPAA